MSEKNSDEPSFRFDEFQQWVGEDAPTSLRRPVKTHEMTGAHVYPKFHTKRLLRHITVDQGDLHEIARDFRRHGGRVVRVDDLCYIVEVNTGTFSILGLHVSAG